VIHTSTIAAVPRDVDVVVDPSELDLVVNINAHYGFELDQPTESVGVYLYDPIRDEHHITYNFIARNLGNTEETLNITVSSVLDWVVNVTQPIIVLEPNDIMPSIPIEVIVPSQAQLNPQTLTVTARALNAPDSPTETLELQLTFPDLRIKAGDVSGNVDGESLEWPKDAPGFGPVLAIGAILGVAMLSRSRRRWSQ
jgi:hypothetical protein